MKKSVHCRGFTPIILVLLLGAVLLGTVGVGYLSFRQNTLASVNEPFQKSSMPTAKSPSSNLLDVQKDTWKTYTNKVLKFSITHPPDWTITAIGDPETFDAPIFESPCETSDKNCFSILIESAVCGEHVICNQIGPQFPPPYNSKNSFGSLYGLVSNGAKVSDIKLSTLAGEKSVSFTRTGSPLVTRGDDRENNVEYEIVANHKGQTYQLSISEWHKASEPVIMEKSGIFEKMVSSFKFLD